MTEVKNPAVRAVRNGADLAVRVRDQWKVVPVKVRSLAYFAVTLVVFSVLWFGFLPDVVIDLVATWQHVDAAGRTRLVVFGIGALSGPLGRSVHHERHTPGTCVRVPPRPDRRRPVGVC